jgi:uncharacterized membrane protein YbaN (DUF454 family)
MSRVEPRPARRPVWPLVAWLGLVLAVGIAGIYLAVLATTIRAVQPTTAVLWLRGRHTQ